MHYFALYKTLFNEYREKLGPLWLYAHAAGATLPRLGEPQSPKTHNRTWFACSRSAHEFVFSNNPAAIGGISSA
jgi:hypothetical protein